MTKLWLRLWKLKFRRQWSFETWSLLLAIVLLSSALSSLTCAITKRHLRYRRGLKMCTEKLENFVLGLKPTKTGVCPNQCLSNVFWSLNSVSRKKSFLKTKNIKLAQLSFSGWRGCDEWRTHPHGTWVVPLPNLRAPWNRAWKTLLRNSYCKSLYSWVQIS